MLRIAIDGPGGAGKSTVAKLLAERLHIEYVDTGAMYRAIGLKAINSGLALDDECAISDMLADTVLDFYGGKIFLDGNDVSADIRMPEISHAASCVSKFKMVREKLVTLQREIAEGKSVVMDGRDIGTNVLVNAEIKIFLTASAEVRAKRRFSQLKEAGKTVEFGEILKDIRERDYQDTHRELNPLVQADDAVFMDTSDMTVKEVVDAIAYMALAYDVEGFSAI